MAEVGPEPGAGGSFRPASAPVESVAPARGTLVGTREPAGSRRGSPEDVSVVVVGHNARRHLAPALDSLRTAGCPDDRVTVVDVASTDGTVEWLRRKHPGARLRRLERNEGPGAARNLGIREATTPYVLIMDADVSVEPTALRTLREVVGSDPGIAVAAPVVVYADRPDVIQYAETRVHFLCEALNPWQGRPVRERGRELRDVGCAPGCALLVRRAAALEVGLFDARYFLCKEDGDFTHRLRIAGHRIVEHPGARAHHRHEPRGTHLFHLQIRNRWHFMLKNYQLRTLAALTPVLAVHEALQLALLVPKGHGRAYLRAAGGLFRMLPRLPSDRAKVAAIRRLPDRELLGAGRMVVRDDMLSNRLFRWAKRSYDIFADRCWRVFLRAVP